MNVDSWAYETEASVMLLMMYCNAPWLYQTIIFQRYLGYCINSCLEKCIGPNEANIKDMRYAIIRKLMGRCDPIC